MHVIEDILATRPAFPRLVLTIGSFDGVHRGHQRILEHVVREARRINGTAAALTFQPHPREFFSPHHAPNLLTNETQKLRLLAEADLDGVFILRFDARTANLDPRDFIEQILRDRCAAKSLVIGHDFRFGRGAQGDYDFLVAVAPDYGFTVSQIEPLLIQGERVSSTAIRERVIAGDLEQAELFLGRKYSIAGRVIPGSGIGKTLGFPTANMKPHRSAIPAHGVYAAHVLLDGAAHIAAVNIGIAPTIRHEDVTVEAHLIGFGEDIIGREIEIVFHQRLRPERKFPSRRDLVEQIVRDVRAVEDFFGSMPPT